jgi:hypothetical protein
LKKKTFRHECLGKTKVEPHQDSNINASQVVIAVQVTQPQRHPLLAIF